MKMMKGTPEEVGDFPLKSTSKSYIFFTKWKRCKFMEFQNKYAFLQNNRGRGGEKLRFEKKTILVKHIINITNQPNNTPPLSFMKFK